ncbi:hypothetical protein POVCU2_0006120 [Plasmodium ovale curtisi]|uniref:Uncharacterized protein n=1 Tax=Plasmodium ovale curtisi TaxID=864141 RepID=A0A1A8VJB9_PLAOA|nr:hypothetical protein POVCU2_0006120 [Plasmodium ovale curtisi]
MDLGLLILSCDASQNYEKIKVDLLSNKAERVKAQVANKRGRKGKTTLNINDRDDLATTKVMLETESGAVAAAVTSSVSPSMTWDAMLVPKRKEHIQYENGLYIRSSTAPYTARTITLVA